MVDTDKMIYEEDDDSLLASAKIKVFGVGGGGSKIGRASCRERV